MAQRARRSSAGHRHPADDEALRDIVTQRMPLTCVHERRCGCEGRVLAGAWLALDALLAQGWSLVPPEPTRQAKINAAAERVADQIEEYL